MLLVHSAKQFSRAVSITASSGELSWLHCLTISAVSACVWLSWVLSVWKPRGEILQSVLSQRAQCSPSLPRRENPGAAVTAHLQGAWFSAPNHCLTKFQCSHSCTTHFHLCWFSDTVHPHAQSVWGSWVATRGWAPSLPQQRAVPQPSRALASHAPWTTSAKHSATTCAVFSLDQLAAHPCLVLPFPQTTWNRHFKEASMAFCKGNGSKGKVSTTDRSRSMLKTCLQALEVISPQIRSEAALPPPVKKGWTWLTHHFSLFSQPQSHKLPSSYPVISFTTLPLQSQFFTPPPSLPSWFCS